MNKKKYNIDRFSTLFFDGAGTLFRVKGSVGEIYSETARRYGVDVSPKILNLGFKNAFQAAPPLAFPGLEKKWVDVQEKEWWKRLVKLVFKDIPFSEFDVFFNELFELFSGEKGWVLFPETKSVLEDLREKGYRIGIISNFDSRIYGVCEALGISSFFDSYTLSSEVGAAKPSPIIFQRALDKHGVNPDEALHVGDSPLEDVEGAKASGILSVLIDRDALGQRRQGEGASSTKSRIFVISNLKELPPLLASDQV